MNWQCRVNFFSPYVTIYNSTLEEEKPISTATREVFERRDNTSPSANGLISCRSVLASLYSPNLVGQIYYPEYGWFEFLSFILVMVGITMMLIGISFFIGTKQNFDNCRLVNKSLRAKTAST